MKGLRDKYRIEAPEEEEEDEDSDDEGDGFGAPKKKQQDEDDPVAREFTALFYPVLLSISAFSPLSFWLNLGR